jgi:hypothetical protein
VSGISAISNVSPMKGAQEEQSELPFQMQYVLFEFGFCFFF